LEGLGKSFGHDADTKTQSQTLPRWKALVWLEGPWNSTKIMRSSIRDYPKSIWWNRRILSKDHGQRTKKV
jgi:hypothetical protein